MADSMPLMLLPAISGGLFLLATLSILPRQSLTISSIPALTMATSMPSMLSLVNKSGLLLLAALSILLLSSLTISSISALMIINSMPFLTGEGIKGIEFMIIRADIDEIVSDD